MGAVEKVPRRRSDFPVDFRHLLFVCNCCIVCRIWVSIGKKIDASAICDFYFIRPVDVRVQVVKVGSASQGVGKSQVKDEGAWKELSFQAKIFLKYNIFLVLFPCLP